MGDNPQFNWWGEITEVQQYNSQVESDNKIHGQGL